jgi:hypothetical protein
MSAAPPQTAAVPPASAAPDAAAAPKPEAAAAPKPEAAAEPLPDTITVTDYNVTNGTTTIVLTKLKDNIFEGTWDKGGVKSRMTVSVFTPKNMVIRRQDLGTGAGKILTYAGKRAGNHVEATGYKFPDPLGLGTWEATW